MERKIVIPGEKIIEGEDYLPGEFTEKRNGVIYSQKYGLAEEKNNLIKVISLSGRYVPKRGNVVIGKVENVLSNGWIIDIGAADNAFLSLTEIPKFVNKDAMEDTMGIDDSVIVKIYSIDKRGVDVTTKGRGLGKVEEGLIFDINPNKVPRVIGKEGSMIKMIKNGTNCDISVGQNGSVLVNGESVTDELFAKEAILFIERNSFIEGLTDKVVEWFKEKGKEVKL